MKMKKQKVSGYIMAGTGFIMLLINGLSYIFHWDTKSPVLTIMGLVFVVVGMKKAKQDNKKPIKK
jgi:hypothetical protein